MMLRKLSAIIAALLAPALMAAPAQAGSFSAIYAFGDSLSDVGNVFGATGVPGAPYANGQFSNGPVWVQDLAGFAKLPALTPSGLPGHSTGGTDYAWGDATTGYAHTLNLPNEPPTANLQVGQFLSDHGNVAPKGGLYTFTLGANDVNNILNHLNTGSSPAADLAGAAFAEATEITQLANAGAKNFIVALVPDLGLTPPSPSVRLRRAAGGVPGGVRI
jgi:phospholipase/lecithinase/hemolysin